MKPAGFIPFLCPKYETEYETGMKPGHITMGYETGMKPGIHCCTNINHLKRGISNWALATSRGMKPV